MPTNKDLKRLVRRRMTKTGESYTAARAVITKNGSSPSPKPARSVAKPDYAKLAGMSDAALKAATGCTWERWVKALDHARAHEWPHKKIAEYVYEKFKIDGWWAQGVTVGYERIRGLRQIGQRRGGSFEASKSRTFPVPVGVLFEAFAAPRLRVRWLGDVELTVRKATPNKSIRITWNDGTSVEVWFTAKGEGKSSAAVQHRKLSGMEAVAKTKAFWEERLEVLAEVLAR